MNNFQKLGGIAAIAQSLIYVSAFMFFGLVWDFPSGGDVAQKLTYLKTHQTTLTVFNLIMYVVFGIFLAVLVIALHERLKTKTNSFAQLAAVFGLIWVGLVIASGMTANVGLNDVIYLSEHEPEQARAVWLSVDTIVEGIGGGNEIVGGLWALFVSFCALNANALSKKLNYLGIFVGLSGIATCYPSETLTTIFGVSQIVWFMWLGVELLKEPLHVEEKDHLQSDLKTRQ